MKIQAMFFDIDGTLVSFNTHKIPQSTVDALTWAKSRGVKVFISTGRPVAFIVNIGQIEHLVDGYITTNGAYSVVKDHTVTCRNIEEADVHGILNACKIWNCSAVVAGTQHIGVYQHHSDVDKVFGQGLGLNDFEFSDMETVLSEPIMQISVFCSIAQERQLMSGLRACTSARWAPTFTDITHAEASKGKALEAMAAHLGIPLEACMAFGDGGNDISILQHAGIGVAMGNAGEEVKAAADYVTLSVDEDGISHAIHRFIV